MRYSIRSKIITGFMLIVATIFLVNALSDLKAHRQYEAEIALVNRYQTERVIFDDLTSATNEELSAIRNYLTKKEQKYFLDFARSQQSSRQFLDALNELVADDPDLSATVRSDFPTALNALERIMDDARTGKEFSIESDQVSERFEDLLAARAILLKQITKRHSGAADSLFQRSRDAYRPKLLFDSIFALFALVLAVIIAQSITKPLHTLIKGVRQVSKGNYRPIDDLRTNDEVRELVVAFNQMVSTVQANQIDLENKNEELQAQGEELIAQNEELHAQGEELAAQNEEIIAQEEELRSAMVKLTMQEETLNRLYRFSQTLTNTLDLDTLLATVLTGFVTEAGAQIGAILLYDQNVEGLKVRTSTGLTRVEDLYVWRLGEGLIGQAAKQKQVFVTKYGEGQLRTRGLRGELTTASEIYLPLVFHDNLLGVIVAGRLDNDQFNSEDKQLLTSLADQAALAVHNALTHLETRKALLKIQEVDHLKSELLSTVSHELRTPLASVLGFAELLLKKKPGPERAQKYLETIYNEAVRLTDLINDFLDLQRIETGRLEFNKSQVDLAKLIRNTVEVYQAQSNEHQLVMNLQEELPLVWVDPDRIVQVIGNLLSNAIKYSPSGGKVEIRACRRTLDSMEIHIQDEGLGIPEEAQNDIFHPFFRVDNSDRRKIGGTGLGLAISRKIIRAHGGELTVRSVHGQGSTFTLTIPVTAASPVPTQKALIKNQNGTSQSNTVLIVEDDRAMADLLAEALCENGYASKVVDSGSAALTSVYEAIPSAVILDLTLTGPLDGWDVLRKLKQDELTSKVPVIISSCVDKRQMGAELGAADYFVKPFSIDKLVESVGAVTRMAVGSVGLPRFDESPNVEQSVRHLLETKGFVVNEIENRGELMVVTLDNQIPLTDGR